MVVNLQGPAVREVVEPRAQGEAARLLALAVEHRAALLEAWRRFHDGFEAAKRSGGGKPACADHAPWPPATTRAADLSSLRFPAALNSGSCP